MMPEQLVLVRHPQAQIRKGHQDGDLAQPELIGHSADWGITTFGEEQARIAGEWIRQNIGEKFDGFTLLPTIVPVLELHTWSSLRLSGM